VVGRDQRAEACGELVLVDGGRIVDVEVEPAVVRVDLPGP
jgi:hypothetical protein